MTDADNQQRDSVERFRGPDYLTRFDADPDAIDRLAEVDSETAYRLRKYVSGECPGAMSTEDFLAPLAHTEGDVVLRVVDPPGNQWIWWRDEVMGTQYYRRFGALPHYQNHKVVSRRNAHASRLADFLDEHGSVVPIHRDNVPENIAELFRERDADD